MVRDPVTKYAEGHVMIDDGVSNNVFSPPYMGIYDHENFDKNFSHWLVRHSSNKTINF